MKRGDNYPDNSVLSREQQCELLKSKGIIIDDPDYALKVLSSVNYYRFSEYFRHMSADELWEKRPHFEDIYQLYCFDMDLRHQLMQMIEKTEIALRARISYTMSVNHGAKAYLQRECFRSSTAHAGFMREFQMQLNRKKGIKIRHRDDGGELNMWEAVEIFTFGMLANFYANMADRDKQEVAKSFGITTPYLESWMRSLVELRNLSAHYNRVYNHTFSSAPRLEKRYRGVKARSLFALLIVIKRLNGAGHSWNVFAVRFHELLERYPYVDIADMGFPKNWNDIL